MNDSKPQPTRPPLEEGDFIRIPQWIAATKLSLAEIGALVCITCHQTRACGRPHELKKRMKSPHMKHSLEGLKARGVVTEIRENDKTRLRCDLNRVMPL